MTALTWPPLAGRRSLSRSPSSTSGHQSIRGRAPGPDRRLAGQDQLAGCSPADCTRCDALAMSPAICCARRSAASAAARRSVASRRRPANSPMRASCGAKATARCNCSAAPARSSFSKCATAAASACSASRALASAASLRRAPPPRRRAAFASRRAAGRAARAWRPCSADRRRAPDHPRERLVEVAKDDVDLGLQSCGGLRATQALGESDTSGASPSMPRSTSSSRTPSSRWSC